MPSGHYFLATMLPPLGEPGTAPPISLSELWAAVRGSTAGRVVRTVLLADDLRQRQAVRVGELTDGDPIVLQPAQVKGTAPLPHILTLPPAGEPLHSQDDLLWENYWRYAALVARRERSAFLRDWVRLEVMLRNALAAARARSFAQAARERAIAPELSHDEPLIELAVATWAGATDALTGLRAVLRARWDWVIREEPSYSFSKDELAAYAVKLVLLRDWQRTKGVAA